MECVYGVTQAALLTYLLKQTRGHATAQHIREHLQTRQVRIAVRQAMHGERDVNLLEIACLDARTSNEACRLGHR